MSGLGQLQTIQRYWLDTLPARQVMFISSFAIRIGVLTTFASILERSRLVTLKIDFVEVVVIFWKSE